MQNLKADLAKVILGKSEILEEMIIALLSGSHILMEDVPGVGKTTLAKALAKSFSADFKRVQFTPISSPRIFWVPPFTALGTAASPSRIRFSLTFFLPMKSTARHLERSRAFWKR